MAFNIPYLLDMYILFDLTGQTTLINFEAKFVTATGTDSLARYSLVLEMILLGENPFLPDNLQRNNQRTCCSRASSGLLQSGSSCEHSAGKCVGG